ncbi:hypothetical protein K490DRAFT_71514 [Saccharata proteae CBS 121410]|uniref:BHLH domain-containing protein n=1 Tax=Saccharata proteae CBS 121410 TaxID=1314787 RepID=A0A9P4LY75_9PEZI|nr:hypothetical protein K490DRAFT_71514 [Saccharata proteae CBS 121410]
MSLNWGSFLTDEGLNTQNDRWPSSKSTPERNIAATTAASAPSTNPTTTDFSPFEGANSQNYFSDAFYNGPGDYFLSDLEVLEPLGNVTLAGGSTSESSPETFNDFTNEPVALQNDSRPAATTTTSTRPRQNYVTAFPDQRSPSYTDSNVNYTSASTRSTARNSLSALDTVPEVPETDLTTKRSKASGRSDAISACWESPLCPNHTKDTKDGSLPNPSACGGGCAPFLFGDGDPLANAALDSQLLAQDPVESRESEEGVVEIPRRLKRSESESSREPSGRIFSNNNNSSKTSSATAEPQPRMKNESSPDSPPDESAQAMDDGKGKTRRRLPHNQVERKYRESLNTQLDSLRRVVPALQTGRGGCGEGGDIEDLPTPSKPSKAVVLASATAYIKQMEKDRRQLADENALLSARIKALQALVKCEDCSLMQYVMDLKIHNPA